MNQYRQGDILLVPINKIPSKVKKQENNVLAYGEVTGHSHRFESDQVVTYADGDEQKFIEVLSDTPLVHEEHNHLVVEVGKYKVVRQREYNPKANRLVAD